MKNNYLVLLGDQNAIGLSIYPTPKALTRIQSAFEELSNCLMPMNA
jgi:hypothetical protein